jgi:hypothetical protein
VVSVCYIRNSDLAERFKQVGFQFYAPAGVHDAIICDKVKYWTLVHFFVNNSVDARMPDICEEDGTGVCIDTQNMIGPIVFLDLPSVFVLFDEVIVVIIHMATSDKTDLMMIPHALPVQVQGRRFVL